MNNNFLTVEQVTQYYEKGYLVIKSLIPCSEQQTLLNQLRSVVDTQVLGHRLNNLSYKTTENNEEYFNNYLHNISLTKHEILRNVYESIYNTLPAVKIFWSEKIIGIVTELLGCNSEQLFLNSNRLRIDPPGPNPIRLGWHQEAAYTKNCAPDLQIWSPLLYSSSWENGSIEIAPGSHKKGKVEAQLKNPDGPGARQFEISEDLISQYKHELIEIDPGDVVFFSCFLFHRSSDPARQKKMKYSLVARYTKVDDSKFTPFASY